jgi:TolB-like protein/class 3 adenylate cyclase/Tfp pilus assembly protein PilF
MVVETLRPLSTSQRTSTRLRRRLAAILALDVKGYSLLMGVDEASTHGRVGTTLAAALRQIEQHNGRVFSFAGDSLMAEFPSAVKALHCALRIQAANSRRNAQQPSGRRIEYRIGVNAGDVLDHGGRIGGDAVNVAARLEQIAEPGSIFLTRGVFEQVGRIVPGDYTYIGERQLKNVAHSVSVYRVIRGGTRRKARTLAIAAPASDYRPSLAVLPFRTLQQDEQDAYFAAGIVDDIVHALGGLRDLLVIARSSTFGFTHSTLDPAQVGQQLGVRYVLHGSVRRAGNRLRIAAELCEADSRTGLSNLPGGVVGGVLWGERLDGTSDDLFALQDQIAIRVASTIAPQVRERELRLGMRKPPGSMTAYDLVLQGMDVFYRMQHDTFDRAHELLIAAIAHDPKYALAHTYCAQWHLIRIGQGWSDDEARDTEAADKAAATALELDSNDALALAISGHMRSYLFRDYERATDLLDRAVTAGPNCAMAWCLSSLIAGFVGDAATAVKRAEYALRLSPLVPDIYWYEIVLTQAYYLAGRYDEAVAIGRKAFSHNDRQASGLRVLIASLVAAGEMEQARRIARRLLEVTPGFSLGAFAARTPLRGAARDVFVKRLREAGLPG